MPAVEIVDLRHAARVPPSETGTIPWSEALDAAVAGALERNEQVILLLNRRGFATFVQCPNCGNVPNCPNCAIALTVHQTPPALRCHYCGHEQSVPELCVICGSATQRWRGLGTQQLEHFLSLRYPRARIARMDLDTTTSKWAHHHILERMGRGEVSILLGTQMIAKGLDFPNVTVVGVVDADTGLHFPDFRAGERTFQLVAQVAGRAGRGPKGGRVFVQTRAPDHHAIRAAAAHSVEHFVAAELPLRSAELAEKVASWLRRASERLDGVLTVLGPAPCPIMRLKGNWRWHVLAKSDEPRVLGRVVRAWRARAHRAVTVDRDPVSLL
jgi:primosomal protein N' (replication factor Y)